jgi:hypothetical protein
MGVPWTLDILSYAVKDNVVLYILDSVNCLQGILIFVNCVCNRKVKTLIINK